MVMRMSLSARLLLAVATLFIVTAPRISAQAVVSVKVIVEASRGERLDDAYVALVPPESPWNRPAAEKTAGGASVTLEVPEGEYRIVAGARGKGIKVSDLIRILGSRKNEFRVTLPAMRAVTGTVRDEGGQPLQDVTIGDVNAFVEAPLGRLSELAARHFAADWRTRSAADGTWSFLLAEDARNPIVAESRGLATTWLPAKESGSAPIALVMHRGAGLRLTLDREAPEFVVTLTEKGEKASVPPAWQAQFRARRVVKTHLEWPSLEAGDYDIYAQQWDPRTFSQAFKLGTVTLESGGTRELRVELPGTRAPSTSAATVLVKPAAQLDAGTIEAFGRDGSALPRLMPTVSEKVSGGTLLYLDTAGVSAPYFGTTNDRFVVLPVRDDRRTAAALLFDLGGGSLQVRTASEGLGLPIAGISTFHGCPGMKAIAVPFAVSKGGKVTFPAPAGCTSFVVDFEPFSPLVFPKQLSLGDPEWLGEFTLYASGSAAVRVAREDGSGVASAIVSISARTDGGLEAEAPVAEETTGADGWARFDRLPAGRELAIVAWTADGEVSVIERVRTEPTQQSVIDPLKMPKPASLIVEPQLAPDFLRQFPNGSILLLSLEPLDGAAERRTADVEGAERIEFNRLLPGRWQLGAMVTTGQGYQPVQVEEIEIKAGESKTLEALITPLVFRGRIDGGGQDLSGNIDILSSRRSDVVPSVPISPSGDFVAVLPRRDTYFVGVRTRSTGQLIWVGNTPFLEPSRLVEITLPRGVVVARVREGGQPVANAMVMARMRHQPTTDVPLIALPVKSGSDGEARIEGLLPGEWIVFVLGNGQAEKSVTVSNTEVIHADLDVTSGLSITGTVMETFGAPVSGAKVTCLLPGPDGVPSLRLAFTGNDGSFDIGDRVASRSTVLCSVTSFSGAQGYRVVGGEHARLVLPANPASLRVTALPAMDRFSGLWLVSRDGRLIEVSPFVPRQPGKVALHIPALAPEAWRLVRVSSPSDWMALTTGGATLTAIADVTLKPDEKRTLDLESAERENAAHGQHK